ncbi:MAG: hypothetical protein V8Q84_06995 [Bilophila sp.]
MVASYVISRRTQPRNTDARAPWRETLAAFSRAKYALVVPASSSAASTAASPPPLRRGASAVHLCLRDRGANPEDPDMEKRS